MITFDLSSEGYICNYLTAGPVVSDFLPPFTDKNQLAFESKMRKLYNVPCKEEPASGALGEGADIGGQWSYYANNRNPYIDYSKFYFKLKNVKIHAITQLVSDKEQTVRARIWSYARVNLWMNGVRIAHIDEPVYKPISFCDFEMALKKGINDIFISMENFGVRDTRNMFSLQLKDPDGICVTLPGDEEELMQLKAAEEWICALRADSEKIISAASPVAPVTVMLNNEEYSWEKEAVFRIDGAHTVTVRLVACGQEFQRVLELPQNITLEMSEKGTSFEERRKQDLVCVAETPTDFGKIHSDHATIYYALAHYALTGSFDERDYQRIYASIEAVKERLDCADFALAGLFVALKYTKPTKECEQDIKAAALDFRYWMDQEGADAMCFWSENHALLFFTCQMIAGLLWEDAFFHRSGKDGKEQYAEGRRRVDEWFDIVEQDGFEEFLASGYLLVTLGSLLLVHMYGDDALKLRAKNTMDRIVREACLQCFDGIHLAPMGRVYRGTIAPYSSGLQALLWLIDGNNMKCTSRFLPLLCYSDYTFPEDAKRLIYDPAEVSFTTGRAKVTTKKMQGYILTSVASPRKDVIEESPYKNTEYYDVLLMNEWFHGTSCFVPGAYGYQQHLWYAAISRRCFTFVTHPGVAKDLESSKMRPGYWFGNGVIPGIVQDGSTLYVYYKIPDAHPTKFTHVYWPSFAMEEERSENHMKFARVKDSYMALWCSEELKLNNEGALMNCDYRAYGDTCAWVIRVGTKDEFESFDRFIDEFKKITLDKDAVKRTIGLEEGAKHK